MFYIRFSVNVRFSFHIVTPHTQCRLKLLKQDRIKDYLLMEEEFIRNQEQMKPLEEKQEVHHPSIFSLALLFVCLSVLMVMFFFLLLLGGKVKSWWPQGNSYVCGDPGGDHWWQSCHRLHICGLGALCQHSVICRQRSAGARLLCFTQPQGTISTKPLRI